MSEIKIVNPLEYADWDDLLLTNNECSFFQSSGWAKVLTESYHYKPLYFAQIDHERLSALLPLMEVKNLLLGKKGISLPFSDYCPPVALNSKQLRKIIESAISHGKESGWKYVELRGGGDHLQNITSSSSYYNHTLSLENGEKAIFTSLRGSTQRNIKQSLKKKVIVRISNSPDSMKEFYRLHCLTRKRHSLPPQPFHFFKNIYDYIISKGKANILLASLGKSNIASALFFHFGVKALYKFGASDAQYNHYRPNNLVMWEAIKWYAGNGYETLDFGRTAFSNNGLSQYKRGWGTEESIINYYKYDFRRDDFVQNHSIVEPLFPIFKSFPVSLLRIIGNVLYRYAA